MILDSMSEKTAQLNEWVAQSRRMVFFGGAGVSTESGIPDFRSVDGLYSQRFRYPPEQMLSRPFYDAHKEEFFEFYRAKVLVHDARPNITHQKLAALEQSGRLAGVVTQNIDGLHQAAGSQTVVELHGSIHRNFCQKCGKAWPLAHMKGPGLPLCSCGGNVKPDVVLYGEGLDQSAVQTAVRLIREADLLVVGGTSLVVYPAAGLLDYYTGRRLVLINRDATARDAAADLLITGSLGEVFGRIDAWPPKR